MSFQHGDVRDLEDLLAVGEIDALLEYSAEPSALAGVDGSPDYLVQSNLLGAYNRPWRQRRGYGSRSLLKASTCARTLRFGAADVTPRGLLAMFGADCAGSDRPLVSRSPSPGGRTPVGLPGRKNDRRAPRPQAVGLPRFRLAQGVLYLPADFFVYVRGKRRQAVRRASGGG